LQTYKCLTILVVGSPPYWKDRPKPYSVPPDEGIHYCDQNSDKMPKAVLLPVIVAVNKCTEKAGKEPYKWSSVDIVTDRGNLRKLMRWADNGATKDFRIDMQLAGKGTVLLTRFAERTREMFSGCTFGYSFERESTVVAPGCKDSYSHHRIITYVRCSFYLTSKIF